MNKILILFPILFFSMNLLAQVNSYTIDIAPQHNYSHLGFEVAEVIDRRIVKSNIGFVLKGMHNRRVPAVLPDSFEIYLTETFRKIIISKGEKITLLIHEFNVSEVTKNTSEIGVFRIQIEFARNIDGKLYSLYHSEHQIEGKALDVTHKHDYRIMQGILSCFADFAKSGWQDKPGELIDKNPTFGYDYNAAPQRGLYASFSKMGKNEPMSKDTFTIMKYRSKEKHVRYYIVDGKRKKIKNRIMAFSNGEYVYLNALRYCYESYYTRSKFIGKYIYFEDKYPDPIAGVAFGIVGSAISNTTKAIVLDTETGLVTILDDRELTKLLNKYPDVKKSYVESDQKIADKKAAVQAINELYF